MKILLEILIFFISSTTLCFASSSDITGFRDLLWGMSVENSLEIYPDLTQIKDQQTEDKCFERKLEEKQIGEVEFKRITYCFRKNNFYRVIAYTLCKDWEKFNQVENQLSAIIRNIRSKYGKPTEIHIKPAIPGGKDTLISWLIKDSRITVNLLSHDASRVLSLVIEHLTVSELGF